MSDRFFSFDGSSFRTHPTATAAREYVERVLQEYADEAGSDGWSETVTNASASISWGEISGQAQQTSCLTMEQAVEARDEASVAKMAANKWEQIETWELVDNAPPKLLSAALQRGDRVVRASGTTGTVTHMSEQGWVVAIDDPPDFEDDRWAPGYSSGSAGDTPELAGWVRDGASLAVLEAENAHLRLVTEILFNPPGGAFTEADLQPGDGPADVWLQVRGALVSFFVSSMIATFEAAGAKNYLELGGEDPKLGRYRILLQRSEGKTPGTIAAEARDEAKRLRHMLDVERGLNLPDGWTLTVEGFFCHEKTRTFVAQASNVWKWWRYGPGRHTAIENQGEAPYALEAIERALEATK